MKIYLVSQNYNNNYDTYDSHIVSAKSSEDAKIVHPLDELNESYGSWVKDVEHIKVEYIGETKKKRGVILSSYNAG